MGSSKFYFYLHKYVYFIVIVQNRLGRLTLFKHRLNGLNAKRRVTDCLPFSVYENIELGQTGAIFLHSLLNNM